MNANEWRNTADGIDLGDTDNSGAIELRYADGRIVRAELAIYAWPDGEDEIAIPLVNGGGLSFFGAEHWRPRRSKMPGVPT